MKELPKELFPKERYFIECPSPYLVIPGEELLLRRLQTGRGAVSAAGRFVRQDLLDEFFHPGLPVAEATLTLNTKARLDLTAWPHYNYSTSRKPQDFIQKRLTEGCLCISAADRPCNPGLARCGSTLTHRRHRLSSVSLQCEFPRSRPRRHCGDPTRLRSNHAATRAIQPGA